MSKEKMLEELKNKYGAMFIRHIKYLSKNNIAEVYNKHKNIEVA